MAEIRSYARIALVRLESREMQPEDVEECLRLFCCRRGLKENFSDPQWRQQKIEVWRGLLKREAIRSGLVENLEAPPGRRILTGGFFAFVKPEWLRQYLSSPFPFVGDWVLAEYARGNDNIILTDNEVRESNSGSGLHSLGLASGWCPEEQSLVFSLKQHIVESFNQTMDGFTINEFVSEAFNEMELELFLSNGTWRVRSRFENYSGDSPSVLLGLTKAEAEEPGNEISVLAKLFVRPQLRFYFNPGQQKLLRLALVHASDQRLSKVAGIKLDALGRRFDRIYKRVEHLQNPSAPVFPPDTASFVKRRLLLRYLEKNMGELRPYRTTKTRAAATARSNSRRKSATS